MAKAVIGPKRKLHYSSYLVVLFGMLLGIFVSNILLDSTIVATVNESTVSCISIIVMFLVREVWLEEK